MYRDRNSGIYRIDIRRVGHPRLAISLDTRQRPLARQRAAALFRLADEKAFDVLESVRTGSVPFEAVDAAFAPGGDGAAALRPKFTAATLGAACDALLLELANSPLNTRRIATVITGQLKRHFDEAMPLSHISTEDGKSWLRQPQWSARTQQQKQSYASRIWDLGIRIERDAARKFATQPTLVDNIWGDIRAPRPKADTPAFLSLEETHQLLDRLEAAGRIRDAAFLALGFLGALRCGEACNLPWSAVDFEATTISIIVRKEDWHPKTKRGQRVVYAPRRLLSLLAAWKQLSPPGRFVFGGAAPLPLRTGVRWAKSALRAADHAALTYHKGRHSAITNALAAGISVPEVVAQAGVSAATLLKTYAHVIEEKRSRIADAYDMPKFPPKVDE